MREPRPYSDSETIAGLMSMLMNLGIISEYNVGATGLKGITIRGIEYGDLGQRGWY